MTVSWWKRLASLFFVVAIGAVLSLPVIKADDPVRLEPIPFEGLVELQIGIGSGPDRDVASAVLHSGEFNGTPWSLVASEENGSSCFSFQARAPDDIHPEPKACTESYGEVGPSTFIPASSAQGLGRGVFVAAVPATVASIELEASNDGAIRGWLLRVPDSFERDGSILVGFLPPGGDITHARARDRRGDSIDVSRFADQVDAY